MTSSWLSPLHYQIHGRWRYAFLLLANDSGSQHGEAALRGQ